MSNNQNPLSFSVANDHDPLSLAFFDNIDQKRQTVFNIIQVVADAAGREDTSLIKLESASYALGHALDIMRSIEIDLSLLWDEVSKLDVSKSDKTPHVNIPQS